MIEDEYLHYTVVSVNEPTAFSIARWVDVSAPCPEFVISQFYVVNRPECERRIVG